MRAESSTSSSPSAARLVRKFRSRSRLSAGARTFCPTSLTLTARVCRGPCADVTHLRLLQIIRAWARAARASAMYLLFTTSRVQSPVSATVLFLGSSSSYSPSPAYPSRSDSPRVRSLTSPEPKPHLNSPPPPCSLFPSPSFYFLFLPPRRPFFGLFLLSPLLRPFLFFPLLLPSTCLCVLFRVMTKCWPKVHTGQLGAGEKEKEKERENAFGGGQEDAQDGERNQGRKESSRYIRNHRFYLSVINRGNWRVAAARVGDEDTAAAA